MKKDDERNKTRTTADQRRSVIKGITVAGTGLTLGHWSKPVVESIVLPAHAQTSIIFTASTTFSIGT